MPLSTAVTLLASALACTIVALLTYAATTSWPHALLAGLGAAGATAVGAHTLLRDRQEP